MGWVFKAGKRFNNQEPTTSLSKQNQQATTHLDDVIVFNAGVHIVPFGDAPEPDGLVVRSRGKKVSICGQRVAEAVSAWA